MKLKYTLIFASFTLFNSTFAQEEITKDEHPQVEIPQADAITGATPHHHHFKLKNRNLSEDYHKFRFGGYGEMLTTFRSYDGNRFDGTLEGTVKRNNAQISIPRFVLAFDYKFSPKWELSSELEIESGGTGISSEIEASENGEYETELEKGGEVALEQFHITYSFNPALKFRMGHQIVPVGLTNAHHEPENFFGTSRPEGERTLLPCTWHETGFALLGTLGKGKALFNYQAMVVAGLNSNGFGRDNWIAKGKQNIFEVDNFTSPGFVFRLDYKGLKGLRIGTSYYYCNNANENAYKYSFYSSKKKVNVNIFTADAQYKHTYFTARGNVIIGNLTESGYLSSRNKNLSSKTPYPKLGPIGKQAVSYAGEIGIHFKAFFKTNFPDLTPFVRYEYYNPHEKMEDYAPADTRLKTSKLTAGLNYKIGNGVIIKADFNHRFFKGTKLHSENEIALGVAFNTCFFTK